MAQLKLDVIIQTQVQIFGKRLCIIRKKPNFSRKVQRNIRTRASFILRKKKLLYGVLNLNILANIFLRIYFAKPNTGTSKQIKQK